MSVPWSMRAIGLIIGFAFGVVWVTVGFGPALLCGVLAFLGWLVGGVAQGTISVSDIWRELQGHRTVN